MGVLIVHRRRLLPLPVLGLAGRRGWAAPATNPALVVVVAQDSAVQQLTLAQVRALFLGETVTDPKQKVLIPFNQAPGTPDRIVFDRVVLGMSPDEAGRYWTDRRIRGQGRPPRAFSPPSVVQRLLVRFREAVGYVRQNEIIAGVRVVPVDGKRPVDAGYPLRDA